MFLTVHSTIGALIGQQVSTPVVAFILGYVSHLLVDAVPHGDEGLIPAQLDEKSKRNRLVLIGSLDLIGTVLILSSLNHFTPFTTIIIAGSLGAIAPDLLWGFSSLFAKKMPWDFLNVWHNKFHWLLNKPISFKFGIIIQLLTLTLTVWTIMQ